MAWLVWHGRFGVAGLALRVWRGRFGVAVFARGTFHRNFIRDKNQLK